MNNSQSWQSTIVLLDTYWSHLMTQEVLNSISASLGSATCLLHSSIFVVPSSSLQATELMCTNRSSLSSFCTVHFSQPRTLHIPPSPIRNLLPSMVTSARPLATEQIWTFCLSCRTLKSYFLPVVRLKTLNFMFAIDMGFLRLLMYWAENATSGPGVSSLAVC